MWLFARRAGHGQRDPGFPSGILYGAAHSQQQFWYGKDERDVGYIRVEARGRKNGTPVSVTHTIIDYADLDAGLTSMQRLVGFTVAIAASLIANGNFTERGLVMPMRVPLSLMQPELAKRDIHIMTNID